MLQHDRSAWDAVSTRAKNQETNKLTSASQNVSKTTAALISTGTEIAQL